MNPLWRIEMLGWLRAVPLSSTEPREGMRLITRFRSRKGAALLAYLAYHSQRSHPRDTLIELLWPESPWKARRTNLRTELSWLRQRLEPPGIPSGTVLLTDGDDVRLNPTTCVTDVGSFETSLRSAAQACTRTDRIHWLTEAVRVYQSDLLPGHIDAWVVPQRLRLGEAFLGAMHELVIEHEQAGDLAGALQLAWRAAAADGWREEAHADLIRLLVATGQPELAQRQRWDRERLLQPELYGPGKVAMDTLSAAREQVARRSVQAHAAEAEALRRQLALRTAEAEELQQRLLCEMAETRKLRQELAIRTAEADELWRQLEHVDPDSRRTEPG